MSKKVSDILPKTEILAQLAEEASELAQAALKLRRALDGTSPTPVGANEATANLFEELADIQVCINAFFEQYDDEYLDDVIATINGMGIKKYGRWLSRLEAKEQSDE